MIHVVLVQVLSGIKTLIHDNKYHVNILLQHINYSPSITLTYLCDAAFLSLDAFFSAATLPLGGADSLRFFLTFGMI